MSDELKPKADPPAGAGAPLGHLLKSRRLAEHVKKELKKTAPFLGQHLLEAVSQKTFELGLAKEMDLRQWSALVGVILKARQQANQEHRAARLEPEGSPPAGTGGARRPRRGLSAEALQQIREAAGLL